MKKQILSIIFSIIFSALTCFAQTDKAVVYIYGGPAPTTLGSVKPDFYFDGEKIARIRPEHYFIAVIPEGEHSFHFKSKKRGGIKMEFEAGKTYFLRVAFSSGSVVRPIAVEEVAEKSAKFVIDELETIGEKDIRNPKLVFLNKPNE